SRRFRVDEFQPARGRSLPPGGSRRRGRKGLQAGRFLLSEAFSVGAGRRSAALLDGLVHGEGRGGRSGGGSHAADRGRPAARLRTGPSLAGAEGAIWRVAAGGGGGSGGDRAASAPCGAPVGGSAAGAAAIGL